MIAEILLKYRLENCLSQKQMGELVGATQSQISKWETAAVVPSPIRTKVLLDWIEKNTVK